MATGLEGRRGVGVRCPKHPASPLQRPSHVPPLGRCICLASRCLGVSTPTGLPWGQGAALSGTVLRTSTEPPATPGTAAKKPDDLVATGLRAKSAGLAGAGGSGGLPLSRQQEPAGLWTWAGPVLAAFLTSPDITNSPRLSHVTPLMTPLHATLSPHARKACLCP